MPGILIIAYWYSAAIGIFIVITTIKHLQRFDNTRARAYRTKRAIRQAKGYKDYKDVYGDHRKRRRLNYSRNANATTNANSANYSDYDDDSDDDDVMAKLDMAEVNKYVNSTDSCKFITAESILTASTSSPEKTSLTTTSTSATGEQQSVVESDLESIDLNSSDEEESDEEYAVLDSASDWEFSSPYSATGNDSEIPDEPHWMIF